MTCVIIDNALTMFRASPSYSIHLPYKAQQLWKSVCHMPPAVTVDCMYSLIALTNCAPHAQLSVLIPCESL